uniref:Uncharacterized protein n=1 Tax=Arundo donax TaxID=35708 RepID=A0A0A9EMG7_ARUDO
MAIIRWDDKLTRTCFTFTAWKCVQATLNSLIKWSLNKGTRTNFNIVKQRQKQSPSFDSITRAAQVKKSLSIDHQISIGRYH